MTETEWLACTDPAPMLLYLEAQDLLTDRKQRLHDCACVRRVWHLIHDPCGRRAVETAERYADSLATLDELREAQGEAFAAAESKIGRHLSDEDSYTVLTAAAGAAWEFRGGAGPTAYAVDAIAWEDLEGLSDQGPAERQLARARRAEELAHQAELLRELFGNPARPAVIAPAWLEWNGRTLEKLALGIYVERAFDRLPLLADALEDAGCANAHILSHCRGPGPHVRGCWVVDLLSGRE